jgi:hypothetical protein
MKLSKENKKILNDEFEFVIKKMKDIILTAAQIIIAFALCWAVAVLVMVL